MILNFIGGSTIRLGKYKYFWVTENEFPVIS